VRITVTVNGEPRETDLEGDESLLVVLRDHFGLAGTKSACEEGECGACTVRLDGQIVNSCLVLAAQADHGEVATVEGLAVDGRLHLVQEAFLDTGAVQCGFCTPGLLVAVADLTEHHTDLTREAAREALSGHLCRCTGYQKIIDAALLAAAASGQRRS